MEIAVILGVTHGLLTVNNLYYTKLSIPVVSIIMNRMLLMLQPKTIRLLKWKCTVYMHSLNKLLQENI